MFMSSSWHVHGKFMSSSWQVHGKFMASSWQVHGKFIASSWQVHGKFMASLWQVHGKLRFFYNFNDNFSCKKEQLVSTTLTYICMSNYFFVWLPYLQVVIKAIGLFIQIIEEYFLYNSIQLHENNQHVRKISGLSLSKVRAPGGWNSQKLDIFVRNVVLSSNI